MTEGTICPAGEPLGHKGQPGQCSPQSVAVCGVVTHSGMWQSCDAMSPDTPQGSTPEAPGSTQIIQGYCKKYVGKRN